MEKPNVIPEAVIATALSFILGFALKSSHVNL